MIRLPKIKALPWSAPDPEGENVSRARGGDRRAFDELVSLHDKSLRGFIAMRVGSDAVDDIVQDTWTACWLALPKFGERSRFKAWLYGIAANKCVDYFRARGRRDETSLHDAPEIPHKESAFGAIEDRDAVMAALGRLPEAQREVVDLYYYADLTLPEIAEALKRNLNTVKYQFYRAHQQVAQELGASG